MLSKSERQWALDRSGGRCWFCGVQTFVREWGADRNDHKAAFCAILFDRAEGRTKDNIITACQSCSSAYQGSNRNLSEFRFLRMRQQYRPTLTRQEVRVASIVGKLRFRIHWFWFERQARLKSTPPPPPLPQPTVPANTTCH